MPFDIIITEGQTAQLNGCRFLSPSHFGIQKFVEREKKGDDVIDTKNTRKASVNLTGGTGNNEWYTPPEYVELARRVMGSIDTDPASNETAQKWIRANTYYTEKTNGLAHDWHGNIWINPPYSKDLIGLFCDKLLREWRSGHIKQAVILVNNATETRWFQSLVGEATAVCFTKGRIRFLKGGDTCRNTPTQGQAFIYYGDRLEEFIRAFGSVGMTFIPARVIEYG